MTELIQRLSEGTHPVEVSLRPERTVKTLQECLGRDYVHIRFTNTRGGTELGSPIDLERSRLDTADFEQETGQLTIVGEMTLDDVRVRCIADISLPEMQGAGRLEVVHTA